MSKAAPMALRAPASGGWLPLCALLALIAEVALAQSPQPQTVPAQNAPQVQVGPQVPQVPQVPPQPEAAPPAKRDGFFDAFGRWWDKSARDFKESIEQSNTKWKRQVDESNAKWKQQVDESNAKWKAGVDENNAKWRELGRKTEQAARDAAAAQKEATDEFLKAQKETAEAIKNLPNVRMVEGRQVCAVASNGSPDCQAAAETICKGKGFGTGKSADIQTSRRCSARALLHRDDSECKMETVVVKAACQ